MYKANEDCKVTAQNERVHLNPWPLIAKEENKLQRSDCLTKHRPLVIETLKGQKIKLTFRKLDHAEKPPGNVQVKEACTGVVGYIIGTRKSQTNATICNNAFEVQNEKGTHLSRIFETNDNNLNVYFGQLGKPSNILIGIEGMKNI